jgi:altronate hydrolase
MTRKISLGEVGIVVNPALDNVAVSKVELSSDTLVLYNDEKITIRSDVGRGQRFALTQIPKDHPVVQYGSPFANSKGIQPGELIHHDNTRELERNLNIDQFVEQKQPSPGPGVVKRTFMGFRRSDSRVGTRNYFLVVPASQCASSTAEQIVREAGERGDVTAEGPGFDGIVTISNTEGCGCAANSQIDRFLMVLANIINHPNVGGVLIVDLGCEQTNAERIHSYLEENDLVPDIPFDRVTIQEEGGVRPALSKSLRIIQELLPIVAAAARTKCNIEHLVVGTECGASDAFSGITANPIIGNVVDRVVAGSGSAILSEIPEMIGAEQVLLNRMRNSKVAKKFLRILSWYESLALKMDVQMSDNLVPKNREGGLINPTIKSLGAISKGGTTTVEDVIEYGEKLSRSGLNVMQGPGNDMESVTGMLASGANIICFSTGKGTVTGSALVPVVKVSSTTELFDRMSDDMDFDAGRLLSSSEEQLTNIGQELFEMCLLKASGERTRSEINEQFQFQVWTAGKLSL